jgi:hypothetical protein
MMTTAFKLACGKIGLMTSVQTLTGLRIRAPDHVTMSADGKRVGDPEGCGAARPVALIHRLHRAADLWAGQWLETKHGM